jgi:hypothetical protein
MAKAFVSRVLQVNKTADTSAFDVMLEVTLLGATDTAVNLTFAAPWGSDWRLMARQAISAWATTNYDEPVDGVVFPDLTTA